LPTGAVRGKLSGVFICISSECAMKRTALAAASAAIAMLALLPGTFARAAVPAGFTVSPVVLPSRVLGIAVDPSTGLVYVGGYGTVTVIDGATQAVEGTVAVSGPATNIAVNPATDTVYAATASGLAVIDGATDSVITTIASAGGQLAVDPSTDTVYATAKLANGAPGIAVIDGATNSVTDTVALPGPAGYVSLAIDTATDTIYAGTFGGTLSAVDGATDAVTQSVQVGTDVHITGLAVDSATSAVYTVYDGDTVDVFSAATLAATASIAGCASHVVAAAADPAANVIFVTSDASSSPSPADSTCVIDAATNTVAETFPRGGTGVAADPATGAAYIASWYPLDDVWVATPSTTTELSPMDYGFPVDSPSTTFAVGIASSRALSLSAAPAATLTETGTLPAGVTMSPAGVFSGTPAAGTLGTYPITVSASNGISPDSTVSLSIVVDIAPVITSSASATFQTGVPGSFTVQASGTPAPTITAVDYPSWMTVTQGSSSEVLSGTPPPGSGGVSPVYIQADNGSGFTASQTLMLTVNQPPALAAAAHLAFRAGRHVRYRITATGFPAPALHEHGLLPRGLVFRAEPNGSALIIGTPARGNKGKRFRITIVASNAIGHPATETVTIRIR
jgi:large repetitive protein